MAKKKDLDEGAEQYLASIADYQVAFSSPQGRNVLRDLMRSCGMMQTTYIDNNPYATAFNEGGRNVVIQIMRKLQIDLKKLEKEILNQPEAENVAIL